MEITIYAKKKQSREGKTFFTYLSTLTRKDGTQQTVQVKFRDEAGNPRPENCPLNIRFDKASANLSSRDYERDDTGETVRSYTLWITQWEEGSKFVDHSLDEFE